MARFRASRLRAKPLHGAKTRDRNWSVAARAFLHFYPTEQSVLVATQLRHFGEIVVIGGAQLANQLGELRHRKLEGQLEHRQFGAGYQQPFPRAANEGALRRRGAAQAACQISRRQTRRLVGHHHTDWRVHHSGTLFDHPLDHRFRRLERHTGFRSFCVRQSFLVYNPQPIARQPPCTLFSVGIPQRRTQFGNPISHLQANSFPEEQTIKAIACPALRRRKTLDNRSHSSPPSQRSPAALLSPQQPACSTGARSPVGSTGPRLPVGSARHATMGHDLLSATSLPATSLPATSLPATSDTQQRPRPLIRHIGPAVPGAHRGAEFGKCANLVTFSAVINFAFQKNTFSNFC